MKSISRIWLLTLLLVASSAAAVQQNSYVATASTESDLLNQTIDSLDQIQNQIEDLNTSVSELTIALRELNANLRNLTASIGTENRTENRTLYEKLDMLAQEISVILDTIGQPTSATGEPINATLFSALSAIAIELYEHRDALKTLGENQKNLSKYDQEIINRMDDRTQLVMQKIENESGNTINAVNRAASSVAGSNNIAVMASVFSAVVVAFFVIYELILKRKFRIGAQTEIIPQEMIQQQIQKPECFGNPNYFDPNDETCKNCMYFDECNRKAITNAAIQEIQKESKQEQKVQPSSSQSVDYLSKFGINVQG